MIYLDNAATTQPLKEVVEVCQNTLEQNFGNPSSLHRLGVEAARLLRDGREHIARFAGLSADWLIFTSCATEANQTVLLGSLKKASAKKNHILMSSIEHPSVSEAAVALKDRGYNIEFIDPDSQGIITRENLASKIRPETALVSIIGVHNELGAIQDIVSLGRTIKSTNPKTLFHVDGVQWLTKIAMPAPSLMPDFFTWSAHKFHGPRGVGGIFKRPSVFLNPLIRGGGQEQGLRSGTENLPAIAGAAKALEIRSLSQIQTRAQNYQRQIFQFVQAHDKFVWIGPEPGDQRSPFIATLSVPGTPSEILIHQLESENIYISSGSACSEKSHKKSSYAEVLKISPEIRKGILRISVGYFSTEADIQTLCDALLRILRNNYEKQ